MDIAGQDAELPEMRRRARFFGLFVMLVFLAIAGRLFYLQVVEGDTFYRLTSDSIVRTDALPAVRGQIRDRKNRVLATVRPSYNLFVTPRLLTSEGFSRLRAVLGMGAEQAVETWERIQGQRASEPGSPPAREKERPVLLAEDISREAMAAIETGIDVPGVKIVSVPRREYPFGGMAAHVLGFMNEVSAEELRSKKDEGYHAGDLIGRTGIERQWEGYLRGRDGFEKIIVDRRGLPKTDIRDVIEGAAKQPAVPGNNVFLTIDADVQKMTERALRAHHASAAVVMEVATGRLLALVSKPGFDPNEMSGHLSPEAEQRILSDRFRPLRDKTLNETYFPGSTFKPVSALAALEDKLITPEDKTKCRGSFEFGRRRFKCTKTHLTVSLYDAIVQSCNVYFYEIGARPGMMDRLAKYGADMGLGAPTGLGLNGEEGGFMPTEAWYREQKRENPKAEGFQVGHALNAVIGQGSTRVTLLQMVALYAAIANGGKLWLPQIVERIESPDQNVLEEFAPRVRRELSVSPENLAIIRQGLVGVVNEPKGTAFKVRARDIEVAGKTGTAQVRRMVRRGEAISSYEQNDHAWFVGFAPAGNPRIAFAVLIEHGGHGGEVAAPAAMEIVHNYFETVAPEQRAAPRLGLPRRRGLRLLDEAPAAAGSTAAARPAPGERTPGAASKSLPPAPSRSPSPSTESGDSPAAAPSAAAAAGDDGNGGGP
jgi:penicillin-binding protein 2